MTSTDLKIKIIIKIMRLVVKMMMMFDTYFSYFIII